MHWRACNRALEIVLLADRDDPVRRVRGEMRGNVAELRREILVKEQKLHRRMSGDATLPE